MSEKRFKFLSRFSIYISGLAVAFGVMVLTGWIFHIQRLKGLIPGQVPVKANTAVCFVLMGTALWLATADAGKRFTRFLSSFLALVASFIGLLSFLEYWNGWELGIDQLLFTAGPDDLPGSVRLALMSPVAAADFLLLGLTIALLGVKGWWSRVLQIVLPTIAAVLAVFGVLDFVLDPYSTHTHIAPMTALVLLLFSFAVICAPQRGLGALLVSGTAGGILCRRLLPSAILIPIAIAWLRWKGQQITLFSDWTGVVIMTVAAGGLLAGLTVWTAVVLDRIEAERERAERSVRQLAHIVSSSHDGIIGKSPDGIITSWNPGAQAIYGYSAEEILGQSIRVLVPPDLLDELAAALQCVRDGRNVRQLETERLCKDGKRIYVSLSISPIKDEAGHVVGISTITRDITERKKAEQAVAAERRRSEAVLDSLPVMVCLLRPDYSVAFANHSFRGQFGAPAGRKCYEFCFGKTAACEFCRSFEVLKTGRPVDWEVLTNDGKAIHAFDFPFTDTDGSPLILEMDLDVTEQRRAEQALQVERERFREVLDHLPVYVVLLTPDYHVALDNTVFRERFGESHGKRCYEFLFGRNEPCEICETYKVLKDGSPKQWKWTGPDGRHYDIFDFPFTDSDGSPLILEMGMDVTEREEAEKARQAVEANLSALFESADDMIWSVDTDFRLLAFNSALQQVLKSTHGQQSLAIGMAPEDLLPPAVAPAWRAMYERALSEGPFRTEYKTSYGNTLDVSFNPILEDGRKTGISVFTKEITAKKHTEAELKRLNQELEDRVRSRTAQLEAANSRLGAAQKAAMAGIWTWNISTGEMSWSPELFELFGLPATEQASFETWDRIVHPEDREGASANVQRAIKDRKPPENEYRIVMPEGQERWIRAVGNTVCDENSVAHSMSGICLDITDRKRAEKAVARLHQELERRATELQAIFQTVPIGLAMTDDPQGRHVHGNPAIEKMLGAAPGGELSKSVPECTPYRIVKDGREQAPDDLPMQRAARGETVSGDTFEIVRPDGCALTMYATAAPLLDEKHQPRGAVGAFLDITKQKCIEQELRDRTAQLQQSEQRVRRKLDSILLPEGDLSNLALADILDLSAIQSLLDDFHSVVHVTTALIDVQGKILAAVGWQSVCREFHRAHPDSCKFCVESDRELSTGIAEGEFRIYKCKNRMWDVATPIIVGGKHLGNLFCGQFFFEDEPVDYQVFRAQARMYGFEEEKYVAALDQVPRLTREQVNSTMTFLAKVARMISQLSYGSIKLARSTEQVNRANTDLQNTVKELEAFSYSVSHDLRAPLRHISGFSRILMEEFAASLPAEAQHHLQRIQEGTSRMGQLVDDLLNLGRVGRRELSLQVAGLRSIVDDVIASLKSEVGDRQVEWKIGDLPYVECDTSLIQQVFQNLLANALKFTRPRAQAVIEIGQGQRDGKAVIYVRDNGVGFSMKYADKLFGVFQRLHRAEDFEGTGVGLATVQRIIQKHAGRIWAEAELDKGATFYFTLGDSQTCEANSKIMIAGVNHA